MTPCVAPKSMTVGHLESINGKRKKDNFLESSKLFSENELRIWVQLQKTAKIYRTLIIKDSIHTQDIGVEVSNRLMEQKYLRFFIHRIKQILYEYSIDFLKQTA
ncbi:hypothetical protein CAEBREN_21239 [Caenorhabditis brenneri]|uniref:Uncharacterized protein n=1 Tax=Caenorhabditis brenneri TaxID=135651 RepID=G0PFB1_CAEBE|nr:hypothetical protein CAEBREN_21239 [Caenorhabditis brenneri]